MVLKSKVKDSPYYQYSDTPLPANWHQEIKNLPLELIDEKSAVNTWFNLTQSPKGIANIKRFSHTERYKLCYDVIFKNWDDKYGPVPVFIPSTKTVESSNIYNFMKELNFSNYDEFQKFTAIEREFFHDKIIQKLGIIFSKHYSNIYEKEDVRKNNWLTDAKLNIIYSCFNKIHTGQSIIEGHYDGRIKVTPIEELRENVLKVIKGLKQLGVKRGDRVAICMPMNAISVVIYLAIIGTGASVVSIADSFSDKEINERLRISNAKIIFTQDYIPRKNKLIPLYEKITNTSAELCIVVPYEGKSISYLRNTDISLHNLLEKSPVNFSEIEICNASDYINILFSSGTTGEPKAIPWTHLTPIKCAIDGYFYFDIKEDDILAWPTNIGWMMGPWLIFASLINGASIALFNGTPIDEEFLQFIHSSNVSILGVVPSIVKKWIEYGYINKNYLEKIRIFGSTGEASNPIDYFYLMSASNFSPIVEYCGGTEIGGGYITCSILKPASPATFSTPALGLDFIILDDNLNPAQTGELFILPPAIGLSNTLLNKDHNEVYYDVSCPHLNQLTSASGINIKRLIDKYGTVLRRHGDYFQALPNGYFRALGRADDTMNLAGIKISSIEIENAIKTINIVSDVAAVAWNPPQGGPSLLVLYAVTTSNINKNDFIKMCNEALAKNLNPHFKVYDVFFVDELPRTASNKIIRRNLREKLLKDINAHL